MNRTLFQQTTFSILVGLVWVATVKASPWLQEQRKLATPDPYFTPKAQKTDNENSSQTVSEYVATLGSADNSFSTMKRSLTEKPADSATRLAWEPPRTPVEIPKEKMPIGPLGKREITGGAVPFSTPKRSGLQTKPGTSSSSGVQSLSGGTTAPIQGGDFAGGLSSPSPPSRPSIIRELETSENPDNFANDFSGATTSIPSSTIESQPSAMSSGGITPETTRPSSKSRSTDSLGKAGQKEPTKLKTADEEEELFEPTRLLAKVADEPIFVGDMLFDANQRIEKFMPTAPEAIKRDAREKLIKQMLPHFVDSKMLYVAIKNQLPEGADIDSILEQASHEFDDKALPKMMASAGVKSAAEFDGHLRAQGSSLRKMRESWAKDQLTKYFLAKELQVDSEVTHQAMLDDYRSHKADYAIPARARWEQVMIRFDKAGSRQKAKEKIVELRDQIVYGANLAAVAKKESHGFMAFEGGQHDWTTKGALVLKALDKKIFELPIGELSDYFESADGYHIVRVIERTEATHKPFLEAQVEIKARILEAKRNEAFKDHMKKLRDEIPVEYFD
jgi:parvulin-like peptidyl-prolyl isomerase